MHVRANVCFIAFCYECVKLTRNCVSFSVISFILYQSTAGHRPYPTPSTVCGHRALHPATSCHQQNFRKINFQSTFAKQFLIHSVRFKSYTIIYVIVYMRLYTLVNLLQWLIQHVLISKNVRINSKEMSMYYYNVRIISNNIIVKVMCNELATDVDYHNLCNGGVVGAYMQPVQVMTRLRTRSRPWIFY